MQCLRSLIGQPITPGELELSVARIRLRTFSAVVQFRLNADGPRSLSDALRSLKPLSIKIIDTFSGTVFGKNKLEMN